MGLLKSSASCIVDRRWRTTNGATHVWMLLIHHISPKPQTTEEAVPTQVRLLSSLTIFCYLSAREDARTHEMRTRHRQVLQKTSGVCSVVSGTPTAYCSARQEAMSVLFLLTQEREGLEEKHEDSSLESTSSLVAKRRDFLLNRNRQKAAAHKFVALQDSKQFVVIQLELVPQIQSVSDVRPNSDVRSCKVSGAHTPTCYMTTLFCKSRRDTKNTKRKKIEIARREEGEKNQLNQTQPAVGSLQSQILTRFRRASSRTKATAASSSRAAVLTSQHDRNGARRSLRS